MSVFLDWVLCQDIKPRFQLADQLLDIIADDSLQNFYFKAIQAEVRSIDLERDETILLCIYVTEVFNANTLQCVTLTDNAAGC